MYDRFLVNLMHTIFISDDVNNSEGTCAIHIHSSYLENVVSSRSESTSAEPMAHHLSRDPGSILFLELHYIASDDPITLNALYSIPCHHDASGGCGGNHIMWSSSGSCRDKNC